MRKLIKNIIGFCLAWILLILGLTTTVMGQSVYPLTVTAGNSWDIGSDNNNNVYISWFTNGVIYFAQIVNHAVTGQQTAATAVNTSKYCIPRLSVRPDGQSMSIVYVSADQRSLRHAWRNSSGVWSNETIAGPLPVSIYYQAGAVGGDGTVHAVYSLGVPYNTFYYTYKNVGDSWVTPIALEVNNEGARMVVDSNGGIHCSWMPFKSYFNYRYAAAGETLNNSVNQKILGAPFSIVGNGGIAVSHSGTVHLSPHFFRKIWHTYKPAGGSFSSMTCATIDSVGGNLELYNAIGVDGTGKVYVSWADNEGGANTVNLSVLENGSWTAYVVDPLANVGKNFDSMPTITMTNQAGYLLWRHNDNHLWLGEYNFASIEVLAPNGGENWVRTTAQPITWDSAGVSGTVKLLLYQNLTLIGTIAEGLPVGNESYSWTVGNLATGSAPAGSNYKVRVQTTDNTLSDDSNSAFTIVSEIESVSAPTTLTGPGFGYKDTSYSYSSSGALSSHGHSVQYKFDWGDGSDSGWLEVGTTSASHSWASTGSYNLRSMARCSLHTTVESPWSTTLAVVISEPGAYYNSSASRLLFPEVNWVGANGGGTWVTELQIVDVSGGSTVQAYYSYGANRFGPITIWANGSGVANSSIRLGNILQTMDSLDPSSAVYSGTGGSLELLTQDGSHRIQAASRSYNGNFSCTFPALQDVPANTAAVGRSLVLPNISNNTTYRAKIMLVNTTSSSATVEVRIIGSNGSQVGSTITRTLAGTEMLPLVNELRVNTYSNATLRIDVTSGSGQVMASGQTSNNVNNDPAAHVAVQPGTGFANSPSSRLWFPEVNWVGANNGGTWITELQLLDVSGGSTVRAYYSYGANRFGPITIWTNSGGAANSSIRFANILQTMDSLDPSAAVYSGTGGSLELLTQDGSHLIQAASRSYNGNSSCTFPALQDVDDNTAILGRNLVVPNISNNTAYRAKIMLVNTTSSSATVEVRIIGSNGSQVGSTINCTLAGYEMLPLVDELRVNTYSNAAIKVVVTSGSGRIMAIGQTSNNVSNDPAAHIVVQAQ